MATRAGYQAIVRMYGTGTTFTDEPMTIGDGHYTITDATKDLWDAVAPTFEDNGVAIPGGDILSINYLFGRVTFTGIKTGPITVSGNYLPLSVVAGARSYAIKTSRQFLDDTDFANAQADSGYRHRNAGGLMEASITIGRIDPLDNAFFDILDGELDVVLEVQPGGDGRKFRGFFILENDDNQGDVQSLETEEATFRTFNETTFDPAFAWNS